VGMEMILIAVIMNTVTVVMMMIGMSMFFYHISTL
jgi:hypothetical protein